MPPASPTRNFPYVGAVEVPVPPFAIGRILIPTSEFRLIADVDTTPEFALRNPLSEPIVSDPTFALPGVTNEGVVNIPVDAMLVVPVPPTASVLALKFVVEAFWMLNCDGIESVTAPVDALAVIWFAVPAIESTPVFVIVGATLPITVNAEHETPVEQVALDVATLERPFVLFP